ncbi:MAG: efflux RND transporter periplasmic adaptor subunit [Sinimarinibacterium sp.]|jgi:Cu(I)/Ag(I) efflux system membrane fusion protein
MNRTPIFAASVAALAFAGVAAWWLQRSPDPQPEPEPSTQDARRPLYWYDPMKPEVQFDAPGKSPFMDMELVPRYADEAASAQGAEQAVIRVAPGMVQNLGIRTAPVERGRFWQRVDTVGSVDVDPHRIRTIESRVAGWIEKQYVHAAGERVRSGTPIAAIYAPELYAAQEELLLATRGGDTGLAAAARERLSLLGVGAGQIDAMLRAGRAQRALPLLAPGDGVVLDIDVHEGQQVAPGARLARIADLAQVWVLAEVPEAQAGWIATDRPAEARIAALPGVVFEGRVDYIYPSVDATTRTLRVRVVFDNPQESLKPGMYADVTLFGGPRDDMLTIPSEALIRTGRRSVVIVARDDGGFVPVHVVAGDERNDRTVILEGLREGQSIVVSGQFLLDSEASLRGAFNRLSAESTP